jgi:hypothetical protein
MKTLELCNDPSCGGLQLWSVHPLSGLGEVPIGHVAANCNRSKVGYRASRKLPGNGGFIVVTIVLQGLGLHDALEASRYPLGSAWRCLAVCQDLCWQSLESGYCFWEAGATLAFDCLQDIVNVAHSLRVPEGSLLCLGLSGPVYFMF